MVMTVLQLLVYEPVRVAWGDGQTTSMPLFYFFVCGSTSIKAPPDKMQLHRLAQSNCNSGMFAPGVFLGFFWAGLPQILLHEKCFCPSVTIFALYMNTGNSCFLFLQISFFLTFAFSVGFITSSFLKV